MVITLFVQLLIIQLVRGENPSPSCLQCICQASSNCNTNLRCPSDVGSNAFCGPYQISKYYWNEGNSIGYDFTTCANLKSCSERVVINYARKNIRDCNNDGVINCLDYAALHLFGAEECHINEHYNSHFWKVFKQTECYSNPDDNDNTTKRKNGVNQYSKNRTNKYKSNIRVRQSVEKNSQEEVKRIKNIRVNKKNKLRVTSNDKEIINAPKANLNTIRNNKKPKRQKVTKKPYNKIVPSINIVTSPPPSIYRTQYTNPISTTATTTRSRIRSQTRNRNNIINTIVPRERPFHTIPIHSEFSQPEIILNNPIATPFTNNEFIPYTDSHINEPIGILNNQPNSETFLDFLKPYFKLEPNDYTTRIYTNRRREISLPITPTENTESLYSDESNEESSLPRNVNNPNETPIIDRRVEENSDRSILNIENNDNNNNRNEEAHNSEIGPNGFPIGYDKPSSPSPGYNIPLNFSAEVSNECLNCLCISLESCEDSNPFRLTRNYWNNAGSPGNNFTKCMNSVECSQKTVRTFFRKYYTDCNKDGTINCVDLALMHKTGAEGCNILDETLFNSPYWQNFDICHGFDKK